MKFSMSHSGDKEISASLGTVEAVGRDSKESFESLVILVIVEKPFGPVESVLIRERYFFGRRFWRG